MTDKTRHTLRKRLPFLANSGSVPEVILKILILLLIFLIVGYIGKKNTGMMLAPGMIFTIEPMINMGSSDVYVNDEDGWTVYTKDGKPSAQWEIMVLVTEDGNEVLAW